ncbi:MAG TPA: S1-like domain-containing RNA-binding protein [Saprospiraceae bacterium]|nr:S1-like domain-containing RNA-binding protein [Saprospiraceae bacterium]HMP24527.1 S1-like domain-containing RNA-binding protein [Saprospiraceae bacterium]
MMDIGKYHTLRILRETGSGLYLGNTDGQEVLLPGKYVPEAFAIGDELVVFVYKDNENRLIATTLQPRILLHQFAFLPVKSVTEQGAFLDWGIEKDLFVPFREQPRKMAEGRSYLVYMYVDEKTDRLVASADLRRFLRNDPLTVAEGAEVDIIIGESTDLGVNVIINHLHKGLIYYNELFVKINMGDSRRGYIKKIREGNKIDVTLQKPGYEGIEPNADKIRAVLQARGGFLPLTDKSNPVEIIRQLEMSKKTFKKAVGLLYKQKIIRIADNGIYLI